MRNRAKCKLCGDIIESLTLHDYVECKCGEIALDGGSTRLRCLAKNWENFIRIDDSDKEIPVTFLEEEKSTPPGKKGSPQEHSQQKNKDEPLPLPIDSKEDLIMTIDQMISNIERLPPHAHTNPLNQYDMMSLLLLMKKFMVL